MERKIGEIFEYNGEWYQCVEDTEYISCINCCFYNGGHKLCTDKDIGNCVGEYRSDAKSICFKKLEKVGEPYMTGNKLIQRYKIYPTTCCINVYGWYYQNLDIKSWTIDIEIKQNKEDMEEEREYTEDEFKNSPRFQHHKPIEQVINMKKMKPFDLEAAKAGKPVCTRDGRKARIICFDMKGEHSIVALTEEDNTEKVGWYYDNGKYLSNGEESPIDLMMLPEKKEGWVNIYRSQIYNTLEKAKEAYKRTCNDDNYLQTIKIEWEE